MQVMVIIRNFAFTYPMFYAKTIQRLMERHQIMTRRATVGDLPGIKELFRRAVAGVDNKYYNNEEKADWAACADKPGHWEQLVDTCFFIVATSADGRITGFAAINGNGLLELMYVDRAYKRQGIGSAMLYELEDYARGKGLKEIRADVSYAAEGFFKNKGYVVLKKQERKAVNMVMGNLLMMKRLVAGNGHADRREQD